MPDRCSVVRRRGLVYGVDADEVDAEVPQLVEETVELGLVGEVPGERGLAGPRVNLKLIERAGEVFAQPPPDDDPVVHVVAGLVFHGRTVAPSWMRGHHPVGWFTQGEPVWSPWLAWDYHLAVGLAW